VRYDNNEIRLPEWALSHMKESTSTAMLPAPRNEDINQVEHPCIENCELFWSVQDANDALVGFVGISQIDWKSRHVELFVSGGEKSADHLKIAIDRMIKHCHDSLNMNRVHARVANDNVLCKLLEELGFTREAVLADHAWINGGYHDVVWFGMLNSDRNGGSV